MSSSDSPKGRGRGRGHRISDKPLKKPEMTSRAGPNISLPTRSLNVSDSSPKSAVSDTVISTRTPSNRVWNAPSNRALNADANEFVPRAVQSQPELSSLTYQFTELKVDPIDDLIKIIERHLEQLLMNPSQFDAIALGLTKEFKERLVNESMMGVASDVIFEWAVTQDNFTYTCARLLTELNSRVSNNHNGTIVQHFLKRCHLEFQERATLVNTDTSRLRKYTVFVAEIYTKFESNGRRMEPLRKAITDLLQLMLENINNEFAKTVGQTLKMCGACLEDDLLAANDNLMETLMNRLVTKSGSENISTTMSHLLQSVVELKKSNWGRSTSPLQSPAVTISNPYDFSQEPVFYNTSGKQITREEAGFAEDLELPTPDSQTANMYGPQWSEAVASNIEEDYPISTGGGDFSNNLNEYQDYDDEEDVDIVVIDDGDEMTDEMFDDFARYESEVLTRD